VPLETQLEAVTVRPEDIGSDVVRIDPGTTGIESAVLLPGACPRVVTLTSGGIVEVYDSISGQRQGLLSASNVTKVVPAPDGTAFLTLSLHGFAKIWHPDGSPLSVFADHGAALTDAIFIENGTRVLSAAENGTAFVWDVNNGQRVFALKGHEGYPINSVGVSNNGAMLSTTSGPQRAVVVWDANDGSAISFQSWLGETQPVRALFDHQDQQIVLLVQHGRTELLEFTDWTGEFPHSALLNGSDLQGIAGREPMPYLETARKLGDEWALDACISADRCYLALLHHGRSNTEIFRYETLETVSVLPDTNDDRISALAALSPDGRFALTATGRHPGIVADGSQYANQTVTVWETASGESLFCLHGHTNTITAATFDAEGKRILTASLDGSVLLWPLDIPSAALCAAAAVGSDDGVRKWLKQGARTDEEFAGQPAVHTAASRGYVSTMDILLADRPGADVRNSRGVTPLMLGAYHGHTEVVRNLLERGANLHERDRSGGTPLHLAASKGDLEAVELLLARGADIDATTTDGFSPLILSLRTNHADIARHLIDGGADVNVRSASGESALYAAAFHGLHDIIVMLLDRGAEVDAQSEGGYSALYAASQNGQADNVRILLERGANVDIRTDAGSVPMHGAAEEGFAEIAALLLEADADLSMRNQHGDTPLSLAARAGQANLVSLLIEAGAVVNSGDGIGGVPLMRAAINGYKDVVDVLLAAGAAPDRPGEEGETALISAAYEGLVHTMRQLLNAGANPNLSREDGTSPLIAAICNGSADAIRLLLEHEADPNLCRNDGVTPLILASSEGNVEAVRLLLEFSADPQRRDENGHLAIEYATNPMIQSLLRTS